MGDLQRSTRAPRAPTLLALALLLLFAVAGILRLNPFCLFEPDSADYLFHSRALATLQGFREIDHPDQPLHAFRPPGLPLLLAPLSLLLPYDVVAAKLFVLGLAIAMLTLAFVLARRIAGPWPAVAVLSLVATSPYTLLHATEVLTEAPYVAVSLAVLLLLDREEDAPTRLSLGLLAALLAFLPFLRTIGVALVAAVGVSALVRRRGRWLGAAALAIVPTILWAWRNSRAGGPTYLGNVLVTFSQGGATGALSKLADAIGYYLGRLPDVLLPGLTPGSPVYEGPMLEPAPELGAPHAVVAVLALGLATLSVLGMLSRRKREGGPAAIYVAVFMVGLALYPPRHERLVWPLVPLLWIYAPAGLRAIYGVRNRFALTRPLALAFAFGLSTWQATSSWPMVSANLCWARLGDAFYRDLAPPFYYADWQAAGRWLRDHAPPHARVLTRHSDLGFTSRHYQDSLRFEEMSPQEWRRRIYPFRARYLVVPTTLFGERFDPRLLVADPVYEMRPVHEARDVMVIALEPNRSGVVRENRQSTEERLAACRRAVERQPRRADLRKRLADLLVEAGRAGEAVSLLEEAIARGRAAVGLHLALGEALLRLERYEEASSVFRSASDLPDAAVLRGSLDRGMRKAEDGLRRRELAPEDRARRHAETARALMDALRWTEAAEALERASRIAPSDPNVRFAQGEFLQRTGRLKEAKAAFADAARAGHAGGPVRLDVLTRAAQVEEVASPGPEDVLALAGIYKEGNPGRALDVLEGGRRRFPDDEDIAVRLAELHLSYAFPERAAPLLRKALGRHPSNPRAKGDLEASEQMLRPAEF